MRKKKSNEDNYSKIFEAVLLDERLMEYGGYEPSEITSLDYALDSDNAIVGAVAHIVNGMNEEMSDVEVYNSVNDFLKKKL